MWTMVVMLSTANVSAACEAFQRGAVQREAVEDKEGDGQARLLMMILAAGPSSSRKPETPPWKQYLALCSYSCGARLLAEELPERGRVDAHVGRGGVA